MKPMQAMDQVISTAIWIGAYQAKMRELGVDTMSIDAASKHHSAAVRHADNMVKRANPDYDATSRTKFQRHPFYSMTNMFASATTLIFQRQRLQAQALRAEDRAGRLLHDGPPANPALPEVRHERLLQYRPGHHGLEYRRQHDYEYRHPDFFRFSPLFGMLQYPYSRRVPMPAHQPVLHGSRPADQRDDNLYKRPCPLRQLPAPWADCPARHVRALPAYEHGDGSGQSDDLP